MSTSHSEKDFHVLVIGAGSVGCLVAQKCRLLGIKCTVFEREKYINERRRDWNFGIYHAQAPLEECLPDHLKKRLISASVNPSREPSGNDKFTMVNAQTGDLLMQMPTPKVLRLARSKFRALAAEGLDIQYGKRLSGISCPDNDSSVTAHFDDGAAATGSLLIGSDGSNSKVREYLLGSQEASLQTLPVLGCGALERLPAEVARQIRDVNDLYLVGYHPEGICAFMSLHDVPDPSKPETWEWMINLTWSDYGTYDPQGPEAVRREYIHRAEKLAEPFRSAYLNTAANGRIWCDRLNEWRTIPWNNRNARVTLAGDAAHPMTYHRGQGLNNAIHDAAYLCDALNEHCHKGKPLDEALNSYEEEMQERGRAAVISSGENSLMVHNWEQLKNSAVFTMGVKPLEKAQ